MGVGFFSRYRDCVTDALHSLEVTDSRGEHLDVEQALARLSQATDRLRHSGKCLYLVGNGASAAMASHMALDFSKNAHVRAFAFNDAIGLTALSNDLGFHHIFDQPIRWHAHAGDLLAVISSSGKSPNVLAAVETARDIGLNVATFSGLEPENPLRREGDLNFYVDARTYGLVECVHQVLLHGWLDCFMDLREWSQVESQNMRLAN